MCHAFVHQVVTIGFPIVFFTLTILNAGQSNQIVSTNEVIKIWTTKHVLCHCPFQSKTTKFNKLKCDSSQNQTWSNGFSSKNIKSISSACVKLKYGWSCENMSPRYYVSFQLQCGQIGPMMAPAMDATELEAKVCNQNSGPV